MLHTQHTVASWTFPGRRRPESPAPPKLAQDAPRGLPCGLEASILCYFRVLGFLVLFRKRGRCLGLGDLGFCRRVARRLHGKLFQVYAEAKQSLAVARHRQQQQTDPHRKDTSLFYPVGGKALPSTKDIDLRLPPGVTKKLMPRYVGPFQILERIGPVAYRLKLPVQFKGLHDVFHVSRIHLWREDGKRKPPPPEPYELDGEPHWNVEKILAHEHRLVGNKVKTFFTIKWEDCSDKANTVEPAECWTSVQTRCVSTPILSGRRVAPWSRPGISSNVLLRQPGAVASAVLAGGRRRRHPTQCHPPRYQPLVLAAHSNVPTWPSLK